jgi:hypothetical protein
MDGERLREELTVPPELPGRQLAWYPGPTVAEDEVTVSTTPVGIPVHPHARSAVVQAQGQPIRVAVLRTPSGTSGLLLSAGESVTVYGAEDLVGLRMVRDASATADAVVWVAQRG